jgi:hypothetical protein
MMNNQLDFGGGMNQGALPFHVPEERRTSTYACACETNRTLLFFLSGNIALGMASLMSTAYNSDFPFFSPSLRLAPMSDRTTLFSFVDGQ